MSTQTLLDGLWVIPYEERMWWLNHDSEVVAFCLARPLQQLVLRPVDVRKLIKQLTEELKQVGK